jgi:hypothetical protein
MKLYMFRTVRLSIIRSSAMVYVIQACRQLSSRTRMELSSILVLLESCMAYTIVECTVNKLLMMDRRTLRNMSIFMTKYICEISASGWFYYKGSYSEGECFSASTKFISCHCIMQERCKWLHMLKRCVDKEKAFFRTWLQGKYDTSWDSEEISDSKLASVAKVILIRNDSWKFSIFHFAGCRPRIGCMFSAAPGTQTFWRPNLSRFVTHTCLHFPLLSRLLNTAKYLFKKMKIKEIKQITADTPI